MTAHPRRPRPIAGFLCLALILLGCGAGPPPAPDPRPNVLLISLDTLRADRLGAYGYGRDTSPFLDELASRGLLFRHAFVNTHGTPPSHATLFSSLYQESHRVSMDKVDGKRNHALPEDLVLLPEVLRESGYATLGVTGGGFMSEDFGFDRGFDVFHGRAKKLDQAKKKLLREIRRHQGKSKPIFAFFHTYEIHSPYNPPEEFRRRYGDDPGGFEPTQKNLNRFAADATALSPETLQYLNDLYDAGIRYTDDALRGLFADLEDLGFFDRRHLVVITSDHGEEFGDHGRLLHPATLFEELLRVPLIVVGSGIEPGVEDRLASTVDIAPTIYARTRVRPPGVFEGRNLLSSRPPGAREEAVFSQYGAILYSMRTARYKLVENHGSGRVDLYDLELDPQERINVADEHPERVKEMRARLLAWRQRIRAVSLEPSATKAPKLDKEREQELRSLGYID